MTPTDEGRTPASLDLAIAWLGRRIGELAAAPAVPPRAVRAAQRGAAPPPVPPRVHPEPPRTGTSPARDPGRAVDPAGDAAPAADPAPAADGAAAGPAGDTTVVAQDAAPAADARPTPLLDEIGRDLTALAGQGLLAPAIGRDVETDRLVEALCRPTRPSAALLGPDGIGKASIVEGLAWRIVAGLVPGPLRGVRVIELPVSAVVAGTQYRGQLEERLAQVVREAAQPGVVLFVEGVDQLARAGRTEGGMGALEALRGPLARGELRLIGTADADAFREASASSGLDGLMTPIAVRELDVEATRAVLAAVRDRLSQTSGVRVSDDALDVLLAFADSHIANRRFPDKAVDLVSEAIAAAIVAGRTMVEAPDAVAVTEAWADRASATPTLDRLGRDLVALARAGRLGPIVGRDREIEALTGVLLRRTKRNPALVGPAGSGKTAIVEGLAIRVAAGRVPEALRDMRLHDVPLLAIAAAAEASPRVVEDLLLEARHPSVVLFFDELHVLALPAVHDVAERLKPPLSRGDIAVIGATTSEEYQQLIEPLTALARRFTLVPVEPMDAPAVRTVLETVSASLQKARGVTIVDGVLDELVDLADRFLPNRAQPDKGVDLVEQSVTWALTHGRREVDVEGAREAVAALVGMPLDPTESLEAVASELATRSLLDAPAAAALVGRLGVSLRGLDARRDQPDAVVLLRGSAAGSADALARLLATRLFGRETARIDIDLAPMTEDSAISTLLGSAPGLVGSDRTLPLHTLRRSPWQAVVLRGIDACAPSIRDTVASALSSGRFTDAMGRSIPLGAAIVILTAPALDGILPEAVVDAALGPGLMAACDVVSGSAGPSAGDRDDWVRTQLLHPLLTRLSRAGYPATATDALVAWVGDGLPTDGSSPERWLDREVAARLLAALPSPPGPVVLDADESGPRLVPAAPAAG